MFKIARTVKHIFNAARNIPKSASASIHSGIKYCTQSKGYIEDVGDEFTFAKVLPNQSLIQGELNIFNHNLQNLAKLKSTHLIDSAEIRKLIYARFADEIAAKSKNIAYAKSQDIKEYAGDAVATYNITDEFKELREQGYDFAAVRKAIQNQNVRSLSARMKELIKSGYMSSYSGEPYLRKDIELIMSKKSEVIKEFMQKVKERAGFVSIDNTVLLINTENDEAVTDVANTDLLGEY